MTVSPLPSCSVVIATLDRLDCLRVVIRCLQNQRYAPLELIVAAAGDVEGVRTLLSEFELPFPCQVLACLEKSSARQRNQAANIIQGDIIAFLDDDIEFGPELLAETLPNFSVPATGAVAPRIANLDRPPPGRLTRWYYRIQAGYSHADFGGRLFGTGINCAPVFGSAATDKIAAEWLPSTCLFVRAALFKRHRFPDFDGYSFSEDVHLTARISREARLYFLPAPSLLHHSQTSEFKSDRAALTAGKLHNMAVIAREVQSLRGWSLWWRWQLHRLFIACVLVTRKPRGWREELRGVISARL